MKGDHGDDGFDPVRLSSRLSSTKQKVKEKKRSMRETRDDDVRAGSMCDPRSSHLMEEKMLLVVKMDGGESL